MAFSTFAAEKNWTKWTPSPVRLSAQNAEKACKSETFGEFCSVIGAQSVVFARPETPSLGAIDLAQLDVGSKSME